MKLSSLFLLVIIGLTACGPATLETAPTSPAATSISVSPSPTSHPTVTPIPLPSLIPTPGVSLLLPLLEADCFSDYPAPLDLPTANSKKYQLKPWSVEEAFDLIRTIDENSPPCNQDWFGMLDVYSEQNVRRAAAQLAVEEAILRYPDVPNRSLLDWRRAVNNALMNSYSSDEWVLARLLQALNEGRAAPETLANYAALYSFEILQVEPAVNLFGDGKTAYVYWLSTHAGSADGIYFAVRINQDQTYSLYPLSTDWGLLGSVDGGFFLGDHTKDGIPEIAVYRAWRNGSFCWDRMNVYQWNKDRFEDLTIQGAESGDEGCGTQFDQPDSRGFDTILTIPYFPGASNTYEWNGRFYELADTSTSYPAEYEWVIDSQIDMFNKQGKFSEAEKLIQQALANFQDVDINPDSKYNFRDYLQFQLGWVKALEMDVASAKEIFQALAASPTEPGNAIASRAAQEFLNHYSTEQDLYRACQAANLRTSQKTAAYICDLQTALVSLSRGWTAEQYADPLRTLEEHGVQVASSLQADVDGDGMQDWLLSVKKPWQAPLELYVVRAAGKESSLAYVTYTDDLLTPFQVSVANLPGSPRPTVFLQSGHDFYLLQFVPGVHRLNTYIVNAFSDTRSVEFPQVAQGGFVFKINYFSNEYTPDWESYEWDKTFQKFYLIDDQRSAAQNYDEGPMAAAQQAEARLFDEGKPAEAIALLKKILAMPKRKHEGACHPDDCVDRSRLRYLLALSYELTGDNAKAVQTYWQLWHDDPGSAYAVLARAKLEPVP